MAVRLRILAHLQALARGSGVSALEAGDRAAELRERRCWWRLSRRRRRQRRCRLRLKVNAWLGRGRHLAAKLGHGRRGGFRQLGLRHGAQQLLEVRGGGRRAHQLHHLQQVRRSEACAAARRCGDARFADDALPHQLEA